MASPETDAHAAWRRLTENRSYLSPKLEVRAGSPSDGHGVFAREAVAADEVLAAFSGDVLSAAALAELSDDEGQQTLQIDDGLYLAFPGPPDPADYVNHSCDPNAGMRGQIVLVSMRPIAPGEEVTFDYAMAEAAPYDEFDCRCGSPHCRGRITGDDWRLPELQARYAGYFSPYIARRIAALAGRR